ncbi:hypothetical protein ACHAXA_002111 [Cyclostephanos tholiformis]|uniref:Uncharacterized protein n=1 Tax=Cyclostephanos tholiformis TaxID=382380 RepID=A0ABD3R290_9STRA
MIRPSIALTLMFASSASPVEVHGYRSTSLLRMTASRPSSPTVPGTIIIPPPPSSTASSRRSFVSTGVSFVLGGTTANALANGIHDGVANAVGPIKIGIINPTYTASPCPKDKPIPGEKAMKGMRGLCVRVKAELAENSPKELDKAGVYGYVDDELTSESVLANNPDGGTDAGQFAIIPSISTTDKQIEFEFIAAVPMEKDLSQFENGIGPLRFKSLRVISFPGGQQFGAISPCEMNEFSDECEAWEAENGPYERGEYMVKSNSRTKGR